MLLIGCEKNRLDVSLSNIDVHININRFDRELFDIDEENMVSELNQLNEKYPYFFRRYIHSVLGTGGNTPESVASNLAGFLGDNSIKELHHRTFKTYGDMAGFQEEIDLAFSYYNYHFPKAILPKIVTYVSGFNYAIIAMDSTLGLGLDMYLGKDCEYYTAMGIPKYKSAVMTSKHLVVDVLKGWVMSEFPNKSKERDLLSTIIYEGKILYLMDAFYPSKSDTIKIGYSLAELKWCQRYEFNLWSHLVQNKLLYTMNQSDVMQFTGEGPFTKGFDKASPARTGVWLGWQIIRSYMNSHPEVSLKDLVEMEDAQSILRESGYKPKG